MFQERNFLHKTNEFIHELDSFRQWLELHVEARDSIVNIPFEVGDIVIHRLTQKRLIVTLIENSGGRYPVACRLENGNIEQYDHRELEKENK